MSYSQYDEERHILAALAGRQPGRLLDVGAYHPTVFSNTRALIESGWHAVMVEPSPEPFLSLLKEYGNHPRVTLVHAALGLESGMVRMHATADAVSTSSEEVYEIWKHAGGYYGVFMSPVVTLTDLPGEYVFVNIDAEGSSVDILRELLRRSTPHCICVEHDSRMTEVREIIGSRYRVTYENGTNVVLVAA